MIKAKVKVLVIAITLLLVGLGMNGCKKCYKCAGLWSWPECYKGADTLRFMFFFKKERQDSLIYYEALGYTCNSGAEEYHWNEQLYCTTEKELKKQLELSGDTCYEKN